MTEEMLRRANAGLDRIEALQAKAQAHDDYLLAVKRVKARAAKHVMDKSVPISYATGYEDALYDLGSEIEWILRDRMDAR